MFRCHRIRRRVSRGKFIYILSLETSHSAMVGFFGVVPHGFSQAIVMRSKGKAQAETCVTKTVAKSQNDTGSSDAGSVVFQLIGNIP